MTERDEDGYIDECPRCHYRPVMCAVVKEDKISLSTGEITARAGEMRYMCIHCDNILNLPPDEDEADAFYGSEAA